MFGEHPSLSPRRAMGPATPTGFPDLAQRRYASEPRGDARYPVSTAKAGSYGLARAPAVVLSTSAARHPDSFISGRAGIYRNAESHQDPSNGGWGARPLSRPALGVQKTRSLCSRGRGGPSYAPDS